MPPRTGRDVERNAIDADDVDVDFPSALVLRKLLGAFELGLANALPREVVVPKVRRATAEESLMVLYGRCYSSSTVVVFLRCLPLASSCQLLVVGLALVSA